MRARFWGGPLSLLGWITEKASTQCEKVVARETTLSRIADWEAREGEVGEVGEVGGDPAVSLAEAIVGRGRRVGIWD